MRREGDDIAKFKFDIGEEVIIDDEIYAQVRWRGFNVEMKKIYCVETFDFSPLILEENLKHWMPMTRSYEVTISGHSESDVENEVEDLLSFSKDEEYVSVTVEEMGGTGGL